MVEKRLPPNSFRQAATYGARSIGLAIVVLTAVITCAVHLLALPDKRQLYDRATLPPVPLAVSSSTTSTTSSSSSSSAVENTNNERLVFVTSLPKSGATSVHEYFACGGVPSFHRTTHACRGRQSECHSLADCIRDNRQRNRPPFQSCGEYYYYYEDDSKNYTTSTRVFSDTGHEDSDSCFLPSWSALDEIHQAYPTATWLHVVRDLAAWHASVSRHRQAAIVRHWKKCQAAAPASDDSTAVFSLLGQNNATAAEALTAFYKAHAARIRHFVATHPSLTYVQVSLQDPAIATQLQQEFGVAATCWGQPRAAAAAAPQ